MTALRLLKAARAGDEAEIEALIARGVKGTRKQPVEAARAGETDVVEVLLRSGTRGTRTQLVDAVRAGETDVVEVLLRSGARGTRENLEAAREARDSTLEEVLLRSGAADVEGRLLAAIRRRDESEIEALKREGALSPAALAHAIEHDDVESARALLSVGVDPNAPSPKHGGAQIETARSLAMMAALVDGGADLNAAARMLYSRALHAPSPYYKAPLLDMLQWALAHGMAPNGRDEYRGGRTPLENVASQARAWTNHRDGLSPEKRYRFVDVINALADAGADTPPALAIYLRWGRCAPHPEIVEALDGDPARARADWEAKKHAIAAARAANPANAPPDSAAAFEAEKRAHPAPAAPASQPNGGFWAALTIAGGLALLLALVTCGARPAPAAEADSPGWRYVETIDGDTLAFAVPALPAPLARVLVRLRGVDTPERRRPKCEWERRAGEAATAYTRAALEGAGAIALADLAWGKYGGRVLARAPVDGADLAEAIIRAGHGRPHDGGRRARGAAA